MNISAEKMFIVQCSTVNCHLKEVPEPKLCLERCPELVVDRIILAVRQPQSQERGGRGIRPIGGGGTVTAGNNARNRIVSVAVKVRTCRCIHRKPASLANGARSGT